MSSLDQLSNSSYDFSFDEALKLYDMPLLELGQIASKIKYNRFSNKVYYNINRHINPTNVCKDVCSFCAFSATRKNPNPYTMSHEQVLDIVDKAVDNGAMEIHIVSAHNDKVDISWYLEMFSKIKTKYPQLHIKALSAAEVDFLSKHNNLTYSQFMNLMIEHGVDSMPGGGAEIFDEKIRKKICGGKVSSEDWLLVHKNWHTKNKKSNATMLFGHIENKEHRIDHMLRLKKLQDETGGFNAFIPLLYQHDNNFLRIKEHLSATEILKTFAISRILLHNIPSIKAYWVTTTLNLALLACEFGANDIDGTIEKESISSAAGAKSKNGLHKDRLITLLESSGFQPTLRDSLYNEL